MEEEIAEEILVEFQVILGFHSPFVNHHIFFKLRYLDLYFKYLFLYFIYYYNIKFKTYKYKIDYTI